MGTWVLNIEIPLVNTLGGSRTISSRKITIPNLKDPTDEEYGGKEAVQEMIDHFDAFINREQDTQGATTVDYERAGAYLFQPTGWTTQYIARDEELWKKDPTQDCTYEVVLTEKYPMAPTPPTP